MRRAQLARRRKFSGVLVIAALSWVGVGMGFDMKTGLMAKDFRIFLEDKLNKILVNKEVKLSRISGRAFENVTINEFSISNRSAESQKSPPIFSVDKIIIKYDLLNLFFKRFERLNGVYLISPSLSFAPKETQGIAPMVSAAPFVNGTLYGDNRIKFYILNGNISGFGNKPILTNLAGGVTFRNSTLFFNNLRGNFLNLPVRVRGRIQDPFGSPVIKLKLLMEDKYYTARFALKSVGQEGEVAVSGNLRFLDKFSFYFQGRINIISDGVIEVKDLLVNDSFNINGGIDLAAKSSKFVMQSKAGLIEVTSTISQKKGLSIDAKLSHVNLFGLDVLSQIYINTSLHRPGNSPEILRGSLKTQNSILNYKPFQEIQARWVLKENELFITRFSLGDAYKLSGMFNLDAPYNMDLNLAVKNAFLEDWLIFAEPDSDQPRPLSGVANGQMSIKGPLKEAVSSGRFEVRNGNIQEVKFNVMNFNLDGKGPILLVADSKMVKEGGFLLMDGEINMRKLGKRNIFEDIKIETDQRVIVWEGWDISKDIYTSEVNLEKDVSEDFKVNLKTYTSAGNDNTDPDRKRSEIGLDYKIQKDDSINLRMKEDSAFMGVERKIKF